MFDTVRNVIVKSIEDYYKKIRLNWIKKWYGQCILTCSLVTYTSATENAIESKQLNEFYNKCNNDLLELVETIRIETNKLMKLKISPLIVQDVHNRDVIDNLIKSKITNILDFEWLSQLRFTYEDEIYVKCLQTTYPYGYEYLGISNRLVITPLTDKC